MSPLQSPEKAARALAELIEPPRRQLLVPRVAALGLWLHHLAPESTERVLSDLLKKWHFGSEPQRSTTGNVHAPADEHGAVHGTRRPLAGALPVFLFAARRFAQLQLQNAGTRARALWGARAPA
jgi:hypothetical protein